jgi:hypothetical protein
VHIALHPLKCTISSTSCSHARIILIQFTYSPLLYAILVAIRIMKTSLIYLFALFVHIAFAQNPHSHAARHPKGKSADKNKGQGSDSKSGTGSSAGAGPICGIRGISRRFPPAYFVSRGSTYASLVRCGAHCSQDSRCQSFAFGVNYCEHYTTAAYVTWLDNVQLLPPANCFTPGETT